MENAPTSDMGLEDGIPDALQFASVRLRGDPIIVELALETAGPRWKKVATHVNPAMHRLLYRLRSCIDASNGGNA